MANVHLLLVGTEARWAGAWRGFRGSACFDQVEGQGVVLLECAAGILIAVDEELELRPSLAGLRRWLGNEKEIEPRFHVHSQHRQVNDYQGEVIRDRGRLLEIDGRSLTLIAAVTDVIEGQVDLETVLAALDQDFRNLSHGS